MFPKPQSEKLLPKASPYIVCELSNKNTLGFVYQVGSIYLENCVVLSLASIFRNCARQNCFLKIYKQPKPIQESKSVRSSLLSSWFWAVESGWIFFFYISEFKNSFIKIYTSLGFLHGYLMTMFTQKDLQKDLLKFIVCTPSASFWILQS